MQKGKPKFTQFYASKQLLDIVAIIYWYDVGNYTKTIYWKRSLTLACCRLRESTNTKKTKKERDPCSHHDLSFSCAFHLHVIPTIWEHTLTYQIWTDEVYTPRFYQAFCRQECHTKPQKLNWSKNYESASSMTVDKASPYQIWNARWKASSTKCSVRMGSATGSSPSSEYIL